MASLKETEITRAYNRFAKVYEAWHAESMGIEIKVLPPLVTFIRGNGFEIRGKLDKRLADDIINDYNNKAKEYRHKLISLTELQES
jgi:hypothetical protein